MNDLGLLGPAYTFHDIARRKFLPHYKAHHYDTFQEVFKALVEEKISYALIATENSSTGTVDTNQAVIDAHQYQIVETFSLPINLQIGSRFPNTLDGIRKIYSHPMAIKETKAFFSKYSSITFIATSSTAGAIEEHLNHNEKDAAVIAGQEALEHYGLLNLAKNIEDYQNNKTTFCLIKK